MLLVDEVVDAHELAPGPGAGGLFEAGADVQQPVAGGDGGAAAVTARPQHGVGTTQRDAAYAVLGRQLQTLLGLAGLGFARRRRAA